MVDLDSARDSDHIFLISNTVIIDERDLSML